MIRILLVEDDRDLNRAVSRHLENNGYQVTGCLTAEEAYSAMESIHFDLILSDIMLPGKSGFDFAGEIRELDAMIPILFMTAYHDMDTMHRGYELGIDDYMVKPVNLEELVLRIEALLRRARIASKRRLTVGELELNEETMNATLKGETLPLSVREFRLLYTLLSYPNRAFSRAQLLESYNGLDNESTERSVDVFITGLRAKLANCTSFRIETVRGLGYKAVLT